MLKIAKSILEKLVPKNGMSPEFQSTITALIDIHFHSSKDKAAYIQRQIRDNQARPPDYQGRNHQEDQYSGQESLKNAVLIVKCITQPGDSLFRL